MKITCQLLACFLFFSLSSFGQTADLDSLVALLPEMADDTNKVNTLNQIALKSYRSDQKFSMEHGEAGLALAKKLGYAKGHVNALYVIGINYWMMKDRDSAFKYCDLLYEKAEKTGIVKGKRNSLTLRGVLYQETEQIEKAFDCHFENVELSKIIKDTSGIGTAYINIGALYGSRGDDQMANKYFKLAAEMYEAAGDVFNQGHCYANLGLSEPDSTLRLNFIKKGLAIAEKHKIGYLLIDCNYAMGNYMLEIRENPEAALPYYQLSLNGAEKTNNILRTMTSAIQMGWASLKINDLDSSEKYFKKSYELSSAVGDQSNILQSTKGLAEVYEKKKQFSEGFQILKESMVLKDTLYAQEKAKQLADADAKFETSKKEAQLAENELVIAKQKNRQSLLIIGGLILLALTAGIFQYFFYRQKRKKQAVELALKLEHEEADRLRQIDEMKTQFFTNVSHELRTPLSLIISPLEEVLKKLKQVNLKPDLKLAHRNSKQLLGLVNEVMDLAKLEVGKLETHNSEIELGPMLRRIFFSFQSGADIKNVNLNFKSDLPEKLFLKTDVPKLEKILNNLVSNALKFTPVGGMVDFTIEKGFSGSSTSELIYFKIKDNGPGIPPEDMPHVFDRFFQSKNNHQKAEGGTGIGLAIAKQFSQLLGGDLTVESELGKGSIFTLTTPANIIEKEAQVIAQPTFLPNDEMKSSDETEVETNTYLPIFINGQKARILIVEDNPEMSGYLKKSLSKNYHCTVVAHGEAALKYLSENKAPDLITSDVMMPNMDGFTLREKINERDEWRKIPFVMLTARTLEADKIKGFRLGIDDYMTKPFSLPELEARIHNLLTNKQLRESSKNAEDKSIPLPINEQLLLDAEKLISEKMEDPQFSVEMMAKELGFSQRQLARVFTKLTGLTPVKFILEMRLQKARRLLELRQFATVNEVRYEVGIESASYFTRKFTERFGKNPRDYMEVV